MKIVVLNGSPKGRQSVTMQYVEYLARRFPDVKLEVHDVAQKIGGLEKDPARFQEVIDAVRAADAVLWAFPLYILLVCSQYKRFVELIRERGVEDAFAGKYAATLSTSINFYDSTAHAWMRSVVEDLGMPFAGFYSANMHDLMKPAERERLERFAADLFTVIRTRAALPRRYAPLPAIPRATLALDAPVARVPTQGRRIVVLTDALPEHARLRGLVDRFVASFDGPVEVVNLHDIDIKGGCLGCLRCGAGYRCAYTGKDGFIDFYNDIVRKADVLVFAGTIVARQLSSKWRQFFDRSFFNTHTPSIIGKQVAFLVSGPLSQLPELRTCYEAWMEIQQSNLLEFVSDEGEGAAIGRQLDSLAERLLRLSLAGYVRPRTFLGVAGLKIFRDDIWGGLKVVFRADHRAYKKMGLYDFPQRKVLKRLIVGAAWLVTGLPGIRGRFPAMIKSQMVQPYRKIVEAAGAPVGRAAAATVAAAP
jgi:multimeric flavodoxin WrbA